MNDNSHHRTSTGKYEQDNEWLKIEFYTKVNSRLGMTPMNYMLKKKKY